MSELSSLGSKIERLGNILRNTASDQIKDYQQRFSSMAGLYDQAFKELIIDKHNTIEACNTANRFFGKDNPNFVAIDGTEYTKSVFDMIIFYAGAYSSEGSISFSSKSQGFDVTYKNRFMDQGNDISSCIPLYINEVPEIDQFLFDTRQPNNIMESLSDEAILNNSTIAHSIMTFAELYLAYKYAAGKRADIIFLDRNLSTTYLSLISSTSSSGKLWQANCSILDMEIDGVGIDVNDLKIARQCIINQMLNLPPSRGTYLRYALIFELYKVEDQQSPYYTGSDVNSLCNSLKVQHEDEKQFKRIKKYLQRAVEEQIIIEEANGKYKGSVRYKSTWSRIKRMVTIIGDQIFYGNKNPFVLVQGSQNEGNEKKKKKKWITTLDLAFLALFSFYMLIEECWKNNILLIGIAKDTAAQDFKNHVIPICINNNIWTNYHDKVSVPWTLIEYDAAFMTTVPDLKNRTGYVSGVQKNKIMLNQLFLRSFVQLQDSKRDNMLRSNVLSVDRLVYPDFDLSNPEATTELIHEYIVDEPIKFILYKNNKIKNDVQRN